MNEKFDDFVACWFMCSLRSIFCLW